MSADTCSPPESLVQYDDPLFIGKDDAPETQMPKESTKKSKEGKNAAQMGDILNSILPPRYVIQFNVSD